MADNQYSTFEFPFINRGIVARYTTDEAPEGTYLNLDGLESREEQSLSSRHGLILLNTDGASNNFPLSVPYIHTLGRLRGLSSSWRYALAGQQVFRLSPGVLAGVSATRISVSNNFLPSGNYFVQASVFTATGEVAFSSEIGPLGAGPTSFLQVTVPTFPGATKWRVYFGIIAGQETNFTEINESALTPGFRVIIPQMPAPSGTPHPGDGGGQYLQVANGLSGQRVSLLTYRPDLTSSPYLFFADKAMMLKDNGTFGSLQSWGITAPLIAATASVGGPPLTVIENFELPDTTTFVFSNVAANAIVTRVGTQLGTLITTSMAPGIVEVTPPAQNFTVIFRDGGGTTANIVFAAAHGLVTGNRASISQVPDITFNNVSALITVVSPTAISYPNAGAPGATSTFGLLSTIPMISMYQMLNIDNANEFVQVLDVTPTTWFGDFQFVHNANGTVVNHALQVTVNANTTATVTKVAALNLGAAGTAQSSDDDVINLYLQVDVPGNIKEIRLQFDVGDASFTQDYFWKSIGPATWNAAQVGTVLTPDAMTNRIYQRASARADGRRLGVQINDLIPTDISDLPQLRPKELLTGANKWTLIQMKLSEFVQTGKAGTPGNDWQNVAAWQIQIKTTTNGAAVVGIDDLYLFGASGLDAFGNSPYDYRYTWYNANDGAESNPSPVMISDSFVTPRRQPVTLGFAASADTQVTHTRIYRRGGVLNDNWYKVADVSIPAVTYEDFAADSDIVGEKLLELDNDPPVTSALPVPMSTTISVIYPAIVATNNQIGGIQRFNTASPHGLFAGQLVMWENISNVIPAVSKQYTVLTVPQPTVFTLAEMGAFGITNDFIGVHSMVQPIAANLPTPLAPIYPVEIISYTSTTGPAPVFTTAYPHGLLSGSFALLSFDQFNSGFLGVFNIPIILSTVTATTFTTISSIPGITARSGGGLGTIRPWPNQITPTAQLSTPPTLSGPLYFELASAAGLAVNQQIQIGMPANLEVTSIDSINGVIQVNQNTAISMVFITLSGLAVATFVDGVSTFPVGATVMVTGNTATLANGTHVVSASGPGFIDWNGPLPGISSVTGFGGAVTATTLLNPIMTTTVQHRFSSGAGFTPFQYNHIGDPVSNLAIPRQTVNIGTIAFDRAWLAGDPNSPHVLYFSKKQRPQSFPPQNFIEVGDPTDPIMAIIGFKGSLFVFTQKTIYQILGTETDVPIPFPTGSTHGLSAQFAWVVTENAIWYLSYDGVYSFAGGASTYMSEATEWIWQGKNLGPIPAMNTELVEDTIMAYGPGQEVFIAYTDQSGVRRRLIWSDVYKRWRNDSVPATAMLFEKDTYDLLVGQNNGLILQDRTDSDFDNGGFSGGMTVMNPVNYTVQTTYQNQGELKKQKVYNELTLDIDTEGQLVDVQLAFDLGATVLDMGSISTPTGFRQQVNLNINAGQGQLGRNISLILSGQAVEVVNLYQAHVRGTVEEELRKSYDSYFTKFGTDEYKLIKQGWFEYVAPDPAGITFSVYIEGQTTPKYTFNLPQATVRKARRVRFPAVKAKIWRFIGLSLSDFYLYNETHIEVKPIGGPKGYQKAKIST